MGLPLSLRWLALLVGMTLVTVGTGCDVLFRDVDEVKLVYGGADAGEDVLDVSDSVSASEDFRGGIAATAGGSLMVVGALPNGPARFWSGSVAPVQLGGTSKGSGFLVHLNRSNAPCGDVSGLQEGAPWPMEGYCPTRRGMTPFMVPVWPCASM